MPSSIPTKPLHRILPCPLRRIPCQGKNQLVLSHINARSIPKHISELRSICSAFRPHIFSVTETWLKSHHSNKLVEIPGYQIFRNDRLSNRGGGVASYVEVGLKPRIMIQSTSESWEVLGLMFHSGNSDYGVLTVYRHDCTFSDHHLDELSALLDDAYVLLPNLLIMGDFNFNLAAPSVLCSRFLSLLESRDLKVHNSEPTRLGNTSASVLDLLITPSSFLPSSTGQFMGVADHDLIYATFHSMGAEPPKTPTISYRDYSRCTAEALDADIQEIDWTPLYNREHVDDKVTFFNNNVVQLFNNHIPLKTITLRHLDDRVMKDKDVALSIQLKRLAYLHWRKVRTEDSREAFKSASRIADRMIRAKRQNFFSDHLGDTPDWRKIRNLGVLNSSKEPANVDPEEFNQFLCEPAAAHPAPPSPGSLLHPEPVVSTPHPASSERSSASTLALHPPLDSQGTPTPPSAYSPSLNHPSHSFSFSTVRELEVLEALRKIRSNACGSDGLPIKFVKMAIPLLLPHITHLINSCISSSSFPTAWKSGLITPIAKISTPVELGDWRPITILPAISKILEHILVDQINSHLNSLNLLTEFQSGFRGNHSTEAALVKICHDLRTFGDDGDLGLLLLLDLSKAFDTVPHLRLCEKLSSLFRFSSPATNLIASFLSDRSQAVISRSTKSSFLPVRRGVPQGSVLAPLLFIMYVNDISNIFDGASFHLYADDLQIYTRMAPPQAPEVTNGVSQLLSQVVTWCVSNGLSINPSKSQAMLIGPNAPNQEEANILPRVTLCNTPISYNQLEVKNLGVLFDPRLTWKRHAAKISARINYGLRTLYPLCKSIPPKLKVLLVKTLLIPHFSYASNVLLPIQGNVLGPLNKALNSCVRLAYGLRRRDSTSAYVKKLLGGTLIDFLRIRLLEFIFKIKSGLLPNYLNSLVSWCRSNPSRIRIPYRHLSFGIKSPIIEGSILWNDLPAHIRDISSLKKFKLEVRKHFDFGQEPPN